MLQDKIKEWEQEMPEGLHEQFGECRYCGQSKLLRTAAPWSEEDCNEAATEMCSCASAREYARKKKRKENVIQAIKENFGEKAALQLPEVEEIMMAAVESITEDKIDSVTVKTGNAKCCLSSTAKGTVKVARTVTKNDSMEV